MWPGKNTGMPSRCTDQDQESYVTHGVQGQVGQPDLVSDLVIANSVHRSRYGTEVV